jgi:poly(A) polymerase
MIRAVKYAAIAVFRLPLRLRWKIRAQSALLRSVSPSRLTEEILKIINSPAAARIVESLREFGLYEYLQPEASALMRDNSGFRLRYMKTLTELGRRIEEGIGSGEAMAALIRDYLEDRVDWQADASESYKNAFIAARKFVLPMNPPRVELDQGVRLIFGGHGITLKKARFFERERPAARRKDGAVREDRGAGEETGRKEGETGEGPGRETVHRKRRRHGRASVPDSPGESPRASV